MNPDFRPSLLIIYIYIYNILPVTSYVPFPGSRLAFGVVIQEPSCSLVSKREFIMSLRFTQQVIVFTVLQELKKPIV